MDHGGIIISQNALIEAMLFGHFFGAVAPTV